MFVCTVAGVIALLKENEPEVKVASIILSWLVIIFVAVINY